MDYEFDNALLWDDENGGKPAVRTKRRSTTTSVKSTTSTSGGGVDISAYAAATIAATANDSHRGTLESIRPITPAPRFTLTPQATQRSLYTTSEASSSRSYPQARTTTSKPSVGASSQAPYRNAHQQYIPPPPMESDSKSNAPPPPSYDGLGYYKYGQPVFYSSDSQNSHHHHHHPNRAKRQQQQQQKDQSRARAHTPYTSNSSRSASVSRPPQSSRTGGRRSIPRGSETDVEDAAGIRSAYITPNLYLSDLHTLGLGPDGYEGPDGFLRDNDADRAERAGFEPDSYFGLPQRRHPEFDERFFGPRNTNIRHIAVKTNTHLSMPTDNDVPDIQIWGTPENIMLAKRDLQALMDHISLDIMDNAVRVGGTWARINAAPSDRKQALIDKVSREAAIRRRYRQSPEEGTAFKAIGIFVWPTKEINPQTSLGMAFEALDAVRFDCEVYIIFSRKRSMFRVLGDNPKNVDVAVSRIYGAFCEIAAKNRKPSKKFLVHPPSMGLPGVAVRVVKRHNLENRQVTIKRLPENVGVQVFLTGSPPSKRFLNEWQVKRERMEAANYFYLKKVVQQGLNDVCYFRGYSALKIHFGTLVLFGYKKPTGGMFTLGDFCEMMGDPQTVGEVIRYIGEESVAKAIIVECDSNQELFHPAESKLNGFNYPTTNHTFSPSPPPVDELVVEPTLFATFEIRMYDDKGQTNDIRLEVKFELVPGDLPGDMTNEAGELWKAGMRRWLHVRSTLTRHNEKTGDAFTRRRGPFEIKSFDLERDIAWQIELSAYQLYKDTDIYPIFAEFARKLRVEEIPDETDPLGVPAEGEPDRRRKVKRISYVNLPGMTVETVIMKTKYQYWVQGTSYLFEVTRYEHFNTDHVNRLYPDGIAITWKGLKTNHDIRWGASLTNADWLNTLSKQQGLGVGCVGGWDPDIDEFLQSSGVGGFDHPACTRDRSVKAHGTPDPWNGDGFREMYHRIGEFTSMIARIRDSVLIKELEEMARAEELESD